jgi:hypothetical protein
VDRDAALDYLAALEDSEFTALAAARTLRRRSVSPGSGRRQHRRHVIDPETTEPTPA